MGKYVERTGINCCGCGKFIKYADIDSGAASHTMLTPDSHVSREEWESLCAECKKKESEKKHG